jgi:hypothetical protein
MNGTQLFFESRALGKAETASENYFKPNIYGSKADGIRFVWGWISENFFGTLKYFHA